MGQKEFFINTIELVDIHGGTNIPTSLLYRPGKQLCIGAEALSLTRDRDEVNEDFKVDIGNQKPGSTSVRRFRCGDGVERSAAELTADFLRETLTHVSRWLEQREIKKGTNILIAEPLAMQEDLVTEGWLANYRTNIRRILQGKGFENVDFLPEPFAVYQYYRYGEKHPLVAERRKHNALVVDFGGWDVRRVCHHHNERRRHQPRRQNGKTLVGVVESNRGLLCQSRHCRRAHQKSSCTPKHRREAQPSLRFISSLEKRRTGPQILVSGLSQLHSPLSSACLPS